MSPEQRQEWARQSARSWAWDSLYEIPCFLGAVGAALDDHFSTNWIAVTGVAIRIAMGIERVIEQRYREALVNSSHNEQRS